MTTTSLAEVDADVVVAGLADGASLPVELADARGAAATKSAFKKVAVLHPDEPATALVVGLGEPAKLDPERLRVAAAIAAKRAAGLDAKSVAWALPGAADAAEAAAAIVEGTILAGYRFDRYSSREEGEPEPVAIERLRLIAATADEPAVDAAARVAAVAAEAANRARTLQNLPSNDLTPAALAEDRKSVV